MDNNELPPVRNEITPTQEQAWELYRAVQEDIQIQHRAFIRAGRKLKTIRDDKLYRYIGDGGYETFKSFLNNPEIGLRPTTAYMYIHVVEFYIDKYGFDEDYIINIPISRLASAIPLLKGKEDFEIRGIVEEMATITGWDADELKKDLQLGVERPKVKKCRKCGKYKLDFYPEQLCVCTLEEHGIKLVTVGDDGSTTPTNPSPTGLEGDTLPVE